MKLSIVTPVLNGDRFIRKNIESIMALKHPHEHIIVDGGSTDQTLQILKEYPHLKVLNQTEQNGMYGAIIQGFEASTGDIITWINCDDYILTRPYDNMIDYMLSKNADFCYSNAIFDYIEENRTEVIRSSCFPKYLLKHGILPFVQPSSLYKRIFYKRIGGLNPRYRITGDMDMFHRMGLDNDAKFVRYPYETVGFLKYGESLGDRNVEKSHLENKEAGIPQTTLFSRIIFYIFRNL